MDIDFELSDKEISEIIESLNECNSRIDSKHKKDIVGITEEILKSLNPVEEAVLRVRFGINIQKCRVDSLPPIKNLKKIEQKALRNIANASMYLILRNLKYE